MFESHIEDSKALRRQKLIQLIALLLFSLFVSVVVPVAAKAEGKDSGGGGGTAHDLFIAAGMRVMHFLENTQKGQAVVSKYGLDLCRLRATLDENLVFVYQDANGMQDHRGSIVDAYTYAWRIQIDKNKWEKYFQTHQDIYYLVFKEMLRSEKTHFDQAITISQELIPFPSELKIENSVANLNTSVDLGCLKQSEASAIEEVKKSHVLFAADQAPSCVDPKLLSSPTFVQQNTADQLLDIMRTSKCQVQPSGCRIAEETEVSGNLVVLSNSIYWKSKRIYSIPVGTVNLVGGIQQRSVVSELSKKAVTKLRQLEVEGICGMTAKTSIDKIKNQSTGEKLTAKDSSVYHGMILNTLSSNTLSCKVEQEGGKLTNFTPYQAAKLLQSAKIREASRAMEGDKVRVNMKFKFDSSQAITFGVGKKLDVASVEVAGNSQSTEPERITIQIGIDSVVPTGGWANPSYSKAMITLQTVECK